jgi:hypothetical protein
MTEQTIAERLCDTTNSTARQLLQDEAAMLGAQGLVSKQLEAEVTCAEGFTLQPCYVMRSCALVR